VAAVTPAAEASSDDAAEGITVDAAAAAADPERSVTPTPPAAALEPSQGQLQPNQQQQQDASSQPATAVLLLLHQPGCINAAVWDAWLAAHPNASDVQLFCHVKKGASLSARHMSGSELVKQHMLDRRVNAEWGNTSLVEVS
jgi:hypothetical protein